MYSRPPMSECGGECMVSTITRLYVCAWRRMNGNTPLILVKSHLDMCTVEQVGALDDGVRYAMLQQRLLQCIMGFRSLFIHRLCMCKEYVCTPHNLVEGSIVAPPPPHTHLPHTKAAKQARNVCIWHALLLDQALYFLCNCCGF